MAVGRATYRCAQYLQRPIQFRRHCSNRTPTVRSGLPCHASIHVCTHPPWWWGIYCPWTMASLPLPICCALWCSAATLRSNQKLEMDCIYPISTHLNNVDRYVQVNEQMWPQQLGKRLFTYLVQCPVYISRNQLMAIQGLQENKVRIDRTVEHNTFAGRK